jgi:hypothetical protein
MRIVLVLVLVFSTMAVAGYIAFTAMSPAGGPQTPAEQLMARNLYRPAQRYHVEDLQARPAVTAALGRLKAADICDLFFRQSTHKMNSDVKRVRLCGAAPGDLEAQRAREYDYQTSELYQPEVPAPPAFAVFSDTAGAMYLIADGKHGSTTADEMEKVIVTVVDHAIAGLPAKIAAKAADQTTAAAAAAADADARKRAQESFK